MGAHVTYITARGRSATEAFHATFCEGGGCHGYRDPQGRIAGKSSFLLLDPSLEQTRLLNRLERQQPKLDELIRQVEAGDVRAMARLLISGNDRRFSEKDGPVGCFALGPQEWLFFGWVGD